MAQNTPAPTLGITKKSGISHPIKDCIVLFTLGICLAFTPVPVAQAANTFSTTSSLLYGRYGHTATILPNGKVLVTGGMTHESYLLAAELYDPSTGTWSATGSPSRGRYRHTATLLANGKVLVTGGGDASAELYDPSTGTWSATGSLSHARSAHTATLLSNGKVLVVGGSGLPASSSAELYDSTTETWTTTGALTYGRSDHTATTLPSGNILVAGGAGNSVEIYDVTTGTWSTTGQLNNPRSRHTAVLLPTGKVLIVGGSGLGAELYNPSTATWRTTGLPIYARDHPTATLLPTGKVLVVGGAGASTPALKSAEVYDPEAESWTATGSLTDNRINHTATLLHNGKVLVAAGGYYYVRDSLLLASAELYNTFTTVPEITVEQPAGAGIINGGSKDFGITCIGENTSLSFTIKNTGDTNLVGLTITRDGPHADDFSIITHPTSPVAPNASTTFDIRFAPRTSGTKTATLLIAYNVPEAPPYTINLTGQALSFEEDSDSDGLSDASESQMSALGFNWQVNQNDLVNIYYSTAHGAGLHSISEIPKLIVETPLLTRDSTTGQFKLIFSIKKTEDLGLPFSDFPMNGEGSSTVINAHGDLEFRFSAPENTLFFRLQAQ